ncbi:IclR family transcriptional regulator [Kitasatospora sp. NPDC101155]|uniref:IclR family transcriptional regulator n=1 Tax=Kitasatospora sp. NPDC101155 TaxID=3364097 RepID=UPI00380CC61C
MGTDTMTSTDEDPAGGVGVLDRPCGVGVLDKTSVLLCALADGPASLRTLSETTGLHRATVHRLALALESIRLLTRDVQGRFAIGPRIGELADGARRDLLVRGVGQERLLKRSQEVLGELRERTGASARLYRRKGDVRICVASAEADGSARKDGSALDSALPMTAGAGAQALLAWEKPAELARLIQRAAFGAASLTKVRQQGWAQSLGRGELGFAAAAVPVRGPGGLVIAALVLDGPVTLLTRTPGRRHGGLLIDAATALGPRRP